MSIDRRVYIGTYIKGYKQKTTSDWYQNLEKCFPDNDNMWDAFGILSTLSDDEDYDYLTLQIGDKCGIVGDFSPPDVPREWEIMISEDTVKEKKNEVKQALESMGLNKVLEDTYESYSIEFGVLYDEY